MRDRPVILHVDLDAFFAAVEQRDKPSLRGKPVVVGGVGPRGVVATASYEARSFGVTSAMPTAEARRRCPHAAYLSGRFPAYRAVSAVVMEVLRRESPLVEPVSLDEAYVDLSPRHPDLDLAGTREIGEAVREAILAATGLTASVGAGTSKLVAKVASDLNKPDGLTVVAPGDEAEMLAPLSVRRLPGIGPATEERLRRRGLVTVAQVAALEEGDLVELLGQAHGRGVHAAARGVDDRDVVPEREVKSVSAEETFPTDLTDPRVLAEHVRRLTASVTRRLRTAGTSGRTVTVKLRRHDFTTITRSSTLRQPTDSEREVVSAALALLSTVDPSDGVRLLGVGVAGLTDYTQQDLLEDLVHPPKEQSDPDGVTVAVLTDVGPVWRPGQDVVHAVHGAGWVQGSGLGRVTVRFEGPHTGPGRVLTFRVDDTDLTPAGPPVWCRRSPNRP